jgi:hypothetical protein
MPDFNTLLQQYGLTLALVLWFLYKEVWALIKTKWFPHLIKQQEQANEDRRKQSAEYQVEANEYRVALLKINDRQLDEIKHIREAMRSDQTMMYQAFVKSVETSAKLNNTLENINGQLRELTEEVMQQKGDIVNLYAALGAQRKLLYKEK